MQEQEQEQGQEQEQQQRQDHRQEQQQAPEQGRVFAKIVAPQKDPRLPSGRGLQVKSNCVVLSPFAHIPVVFLCPVGHQYLWLFSLGCSSWSQGVVQGMPCACISMCLRGLKSSALLGPIFFSKKRRECQQITIMGRV